MKNYWLIKSEPSTYSWSDLVSDGETFWNGIRNYQARNNMKLMKKGDVCLFYHSGDERRIMGTAQVIKEAYADHTAYKRDPIDAAKNQWIMMDIKAGTAFKNPVTLSAIKVHPGLSRMKLVKQGRLSVSPVTADEFAIIEALSKTPA